MAQMQPKALTAHSLDGVRPAGPAPAGLTVAGVLKKLREARPVIAAYAAESERLRYIVEPAWSAVWETGVFWLTTPKEQGGLDVDSADPIIEAVALIGESCVSTAWCAAQVIQQQWMVRKMPEGFQSEVRANHAIISAAGNGSSFGTGELVDGGVRVNGRFRYGSNAMYAEWLFGFAQVEEEDGSAGVRCVLVPMKDAQLLDTWHVDGVVASGSHDFVFDNLFVPAHRVQRPQVLVQPQPDHANPLLRVPLLQFPHFFSASPILGAARGAVAAYRARLATGGPDGAPIDRALDHECLARSETAVRIAELAIRDAGRQLIALYGDGGTPPAEAPLALRVQVSHAAEMCKNVLRAISDASGSSAHLLGNPLQRAVRDGTMLATHATINPFGLTEALGKVMLGLPATIPGPRVN